MSRAVTANSGYVVRRRVGLPAYRRVRRRRYHAAYEHGFNIGKSHQLAIGAHAVEWFDLPLWQSLSHQQYVIDRVKRKADLVALNHPNARNAYGGDAARALTGFDLIEVVNGPFTDRDAWDAALSAGRAVWSVGNDDTHDLEDPRRTAVAWTMIDAPSPGVDDVVEALRDGRSYAVLRTGAIDSVNETTFSAMEVVRQHHDRHLAGRPSTFTFIGMDGATRHVQRDATTASYSLTDADTYVRVVVTTAARGAVPESGYSLGRVAPAAASGDRQCRGHMDAARRRRDRHRMDPGDAQSEETDRTEGLKSQIEDFRSQIGISYIFDLKSRASIASERREGIALARVTRLETTLEPFHPLLPTTRA